MTVIGASRKQAGLYYDKGGAVYNVMHPDFGAKADGVTDDSAAFNAALAAVLLTGGKLVIPPANYYKNSQVLGTYGANLVNVLIDAYGAVIHDGPAVTGSSFKIVGAPQPHGIRIQGLSFYHENNTTVGAGIELSGSSHGVLEDIMIENYNTKANYAGILLSASTPGDDNTQCFWTTISRLRMRQRSGGSGTVAHYGVWLKGAANATKIIGGSFNSCTDAVGITSDGVGTTLANGVVIDAVSFEGAITNAINEVPIATTGFYTFGLRITHCRAESLTTFYRKDTGGAAALEGSQPANLSKNYCVNGSVTNWIVNPNAAAIAVDENCPAGFGVSAAAGTRVYSPDHYRIITPNTGNLIIENQSGGGGTWNAPHLQMGEPANALHIWYNASDDSLRYKRGTVPTSATDGMLIAGPVVVTGFGYAGRILTPAYSASITPNAQCGSAIIPATNGSAFTINAPTSPTISQVLTITIQNASGGALGAITWDAVFKMAAWTSPANGFSRSISFRYNGTNWVEVGRTAADVPN